MKNNTHNFSSQSKDIKTKHVFLEDEQVFLKEETNLDDIQVAEWFPTDFNWVSARL